MTVVLEQIEETGLSTLNRLVELVAYDLSEFNGSNVNENGLFNSNVDSKKWFDDPDFLLYFIRVEDVLAGFVIIRILEEENINYLNHFFILRKYRRQNVGRDAAIQALNLFPGKWRVSQFEWNIPAQLFWRKLIKDLTSDNYSEIRRKDNKGPAQEFEVIKWD